MNKKRLIFLSLNELNFDYLKKYLKFKDLKNFKIISDKIVDTKSEQEYKMLEPWIQWPSIYTGKKANQHNIFRLGDITKYKGKTLFNELEDLNLSVGVISSMNLSNNLKKPKYFIPDPWIITKPDSSYWSKLIHTTISKLVVKNSLLKFNIKELFYLSFIFIKFAKLKNYNTYFNFFLSGFKYRWRKALFLDLLLSDIHLNYFYKNQPNFSNVFFNGIAHIQHHYFFNSKVMDKNNLENPTWYLKKNKDPIEEALILYEKILGDYLNNKKFNLVIATALTQKPYDILKFYYKIKDCKEFFLKLEIDFIKIQDLMSRDFIIYFSDIKKAKSSEEILNKMKLKKKDLFKVDNRGSNLFITFVYPDEIFKNDYTDCNRIKIFDYVSFVAIKNGMHSEKGFYYDNFSNYKQQEMNITDIKDIILNFFK